MRLGSWLLLVALLLVAAALLIEVYNTTIRYHQHMTLCTESGATITACEDHYVPR